MSSSSATICAALAVTATGVPDANTRPAGCLPARAPPTFAFSSFGITVASVAAGGAVCDSVKVLPTEQ